MNVIDLTRQLVAIPSVNPNSLADGHSNPGEAAMADRVESILRELGAILVRRTDVYPGRPNVTGYLDFGAAETLIFDAHMDTVPVEGMTVDPYGGELKDGKVYGRGSCDVKGPMAAILCAMEKSSESVKSGKKARYNILMAAVCDEESGFGGVHAFVKNLDKTKYAPIAGAIVAEPTLLNAVAAHKGAARWIISTIGTAAHSSTPHLGKNAIYAMAPVIQRLESYATELETRKPHKRLGSPSLSIGIINGGSAVNIVPDYCQIHVDRRLIPGETLEYAKEDLQRILEGMDINISEPMVAAPPMETPDDHPLVLQALDAGLHGGAASEIEYANYCTDAPFYAEIALPTVVMGPGSIAQAHTKDEWISEQQLEMGVRAYTHLIMGG